MRDTERERGRDTDRGRSRLHAGSLTGTPSQVSRITPWAEGGAKPLSHRGCPLQGILGEKQKLLKMDILELKNLESKFIG